MLDRIWMAGLLWTAIAASAHAKVQSRTIDYKVGDLPCKGYLAWDDSFDGKRPGVLVVHEWWGLDDYARGRADQLAALGYVAFACDMYGEGKTVAHPQDAGKMAGAVRANVAQWRQRAAAALEILKSQPQCDGEKLAAIGYCFGGSTALQLAYGGADLDAVVTFHAALPTPTASEAKQIQGTVQINHGAQDMFITEDSIKALRGALDAAKVDWEMVSYGGAVHSFTVKSADSHGLAGMGYNANADRRSWENMLNVFAEKGMPPREPLRPL